MTKIQPVRGTKDLFGEEFLKHDFIIKKASQLSELYGFQGFATPIFEFLEVFKRSIGEETDIVSKEMYVFNDRNGENLVLRPEFTAAIVRSFISNGMSQNLPLKIFTHGPLFRYERPQKGRQRQFHQLDFEIFGVESFHADAELINFACHLLDELGLLARTKLQINSLGCTKSRSNHLIALKKYLEPHKNELSEDSQKRLDNNILRIFDSKNEKDQEILKDAPKISQYYEKESQEFFHSLLKQLDDFDINYEVNEGLVRGLDYYCHSVFEFVTDELGAQGTILAGGRYDGLCKIMGGQDVPAVGFAAGIERMSAMLEMPKNDAKNVIAVIPTDLEFQNEAISLTKNLRRAGLACHLDYDVKNVSKRLKKAEKVAAGVAVFVSSAAEYEVKNIHKNSQEFVSKNEIIEFLLKE